MGVIIREHTVSKTSEVSVGVVNPGFKRTARLGKRQSYLTYTKSLHMPARAPHPSLFHPSHKLTRQTAVVANWDSLVNTKVGI